MAIASKLCATFRPETEPAAAGDWNNAANWSTNGIPGALDTANLGSNTVSVGSGVHIT